MIGLFECRLKAMNRDDEDADIVEKDMKQDEEDYTYLLIERRRKRLSRRNSEESKNEVSCRSRSVETRVMQITSAAKTSTAAESVPISSNEQNRQLRSKSELSESVKNLRSFENRSKIKESEEEKEDRIKAKTENRQSTPRYNTLSSGISLSCNKLVKCESESDLKRNSIGRLQKESIDLSIGDSGHLTEENIYEPLWSYRACDSPGGMNKALKRFSDSDDLSLNSDDNSLYSDSSSYSSGNYDTTVGKISGFLTCPPPLPPRRLSSGNKKTNNNYCNIATLGPIDSKSCSIGEELSNICNKMNIGGEDEDHIYQSIYEHIQNTEELLKNEKMPKMEHEEMLKKLIKELQTLVENAKQAKSLFQSNDVYKSNSCDTLLLEEGKSDADVKTIPKSLSIDGSSKTVLESNESAKTDASSSRPQSEIEFDESDYANLPTSKNNHYANFAPPVEKAASSKKNSLIESIIDSTSGDLKKFLVSRHSSAYSTTSSASEAYITANTAEGQKRVNVNSLEEESNIYPFANTKVITLKKFSETERYIDFDDTVKSPLDDQPLYQFYDKHVKRQQALMIYADSSSTDVDDFFDDDDDRLYGSVYTKTSEQKNAAGKHLSVMDIVDGGIRKLWCEVPQVKEQGLLEKLTPQQRKQQEAMFEVITSEASYLKSLTILVKHFVNNPEFQNPEVIDARKKKDLFSNIDEIYDISKRLMEDLEKIWQHNIIISDVCETLHRYASSHFDPYVNYCKYQMNQERILKEMQEKPKFAEALKRLEANACCQGLTILSFILLPMQRITRYPLLVDAILTRLSSDSPNLEICKKTLLQLNKVVRDCNAAARQYERWHELSEVERKLRFMNIKKFPLASASRFLLKKGEVTRIKPEFQSSILIGSMSKSPYWSKSQNYLFLFNDLLVITKKKSDDYFNVYDYCDRNLVQILPINNGIIEGSPVTLNHKPPENFKYLAQITFLRNHCGKNCEYYFNFSSDNERLRWIEAIEPPKSDNPNEKIYEEWDCPQVLCEKRYVAQQPDELTIEEADVINVFRKSANDWYEGEKISDGSRGWFPACHTVEIANKHVRARNLRIRHRLLVLTESMLEKQFKK
ncbi:Rho guanine nucleotide exchange factor 26-like protein [Dinothrombium tinctorium]|uniref:Rho guanine nucleotide exchange factor 26-like protein n=1 Tax=Dinothrombium tinctorium TaxID=1965070 RepID=A0A3S3P563_9ACAR|nr:Rho guanine nucleotide exchange factor 26-like protein [Dinothrombium tinctorium]RWS08265.1 Rho guanine nucleotide exchange factor 26-like protein [Dinothrombium tinctorium]